MTEKKRQPIAFRADDETEYFIEKIAEKLGEEMPHPIRGKQRYTKTDAIIFAIRYTMDKFVNENKGSDQR